ncbi:hypothetical protein COHA_003890 [Chlorella ohadii]|uniref:3-oxoacyl-[acyl-carrier-protein] reductase n=1 Tax=Chlorella ohadii TaxID=2649997 RepID=A0AAD5DXR2_9CHLO|nr:hypothetical protein COHA_003890 [Chlorella ohadii]
MSLPVLISQCSHGRPPPLQVAINYPSSSEAAEQVAAQVKELGGEAFLVKADMSKHQEIEAMIKEVSEHWGGLDVLVNNAGITRDKLMMQMKPDDWQAVIDVNLSGVFYASQAAAKVMGKKKKGRIISLASVVGQIGNAGQANYSAAKGGVIAMTKTIAREYAPRGIVANSVAPGFIDTAMTAKIPDNIKEQLLKGIPLGRMGDPKEVAGLVRYLALDPSAAYITGQCIGINGGMAM